MPCYATLTSHMSTETFQEMKYKAPERRVPSAVAPPSSVARPNYHDALRRGMCKKESGVGAGAGARGGRYMIEVRGEVVRSILCLRWRGEVKGE